MLIHISRLSGVFLPWNDSVTMIRAPLFFMPFVLALNFNLYAQHRPHALGVELGGSSLVCSFNYEHQSPNGFVKRAGLGFFPSDLFVPLHVGKVFGRKSHHPEIGIGIVYINDGPGRAVVVPGRHALFVNGFAGYRYQHPQRHFYWRIGFTPIMFLLEQDTSERLRLYPWAGLAAGFRVEKLWSGR
jgi:hypothetical protein